MDFPLLKELTEAVGTPGREGPVRTILRRHLDGQVDDLATDALGNLIARKGNGPLRVVLAAHMDEVGLLISGFTDQGLLRFKKSGGVPDAVLPGRAFWVGEGRVPGVIGVPALHIAEDRDKIVPAADLYMDIGARSRAEAESLVDYGDPAVWATACELLGQATVKAKALDDRAGCALLVELLRGPAYPGLTVCGVFTVQEEVGARGARVAAYGLDPRLAVALEVTTAADVPGADPHQRVTEQGRGPAISWMDGNTIVPEGLRRHLEEVAGRHGIPCQPRRSTTAGTDAGAIHLARGGIPAASVSMPGRYIHSNAALLQVADYEHTLALMQAFLESLDKGEFRP